MCPLPGPGMGKKGQGRRIKVVLTPLHRVYSKKAEWGEIRPMDFIRYYLRDEMASPCNIDSNFWLPIWLFLSSCGAAIGEYRTVIKLERGGLDDAPSG